MIAAHRKIEDKMAQTQNMWQLEQRRLLKHQHMPEIEKEIEQRIKAFDKRVKRLREAQKGGTLEALVNAFAKYFLLGFTMLIAVFDPIFKWRRGRGSRQRTEQSAGEMTPTRPRVRHHASE